MKGSFVALMLFTLTPAAFAADEIRCSDAVAEGRYAAPRVELPRWSTRKAAVSAYEFRRENDTVVFERGQVVDVSYRSRRWIGTAAPVDPPKAISGIVVGSRRSRWTKKTLLVLDCGGSKLVTLPDDRILAVVPSTATIHPSQGGLGQRTKALFHPVITPVTLIANLAMTGFTVSKITSGVTYGTSWLWDQTVSPLWTAASDYSKPLAYVGAAAVAYVGFKAMTSDAGVRARNALRERLRRVSRFVGTYALVWWRPWQVPAQRRIHADLRKLREFELAFKQVEWDAEGKMPGPDVVFHVPTMPELGPIHFADNRGHLPLWLFPGTEETGREEFFVRAKAAYRAALDVRRHFQKLGVPVAKTPILIFRRPLFRPGMVHESGPFATKLPGLLIAPLQFTDSEKAAWTALARASGLDADVATPEAAARLSTDPTFVAREFAKSVVQRDIVSLVEEGGLLANALGDYFALSALDPSRPEVLPDALFQGLPMREAPERRYPPAQYPPTLNFNSVGQMTEDIPQSAQVLLRLLWDLRREFGRDLADELAFDGMLHLKIPAQLSFRYSLADAFVAASPDFRRIKAILGKSLAVHELYEYVAHLIELCRNHERSAELEPFVLRRAAQAGLAQDVLEAIVARYEQEERGEKIADAKASDEGS